MRRKLSAAHRQMIWDCFGWDYSCLTKEERKKFTPKYTETVWLLSRPKPRPSEQWQSQERRRAGHPSWQCTPSQERPLPRSDSQRSQVRLFGLFSTDGTEDFARRILQRLSSRRRHQASLVRSHSYRISMVIVAIAMVMLLRALVNRRPQHGGAA